MMVSAGRVFVNSKKFNNALALVNMKLCQIKVLLHSILYITIYIRNIIQRKRIPQQKFHRQKMFSICCRFPRNMTKIFILNDKENHSEIPYHMSNEKEIKENTLDPINP